MNFEKGYIYHVYNQGNNCREIFFCRENYLFFLRKIRTYLLPYADVLAYCLMPNHFHWMVRVNETHRVTQSHPVSKSRSTNQSIAILLRSYTRAINKQNNTTGALFREETKAECINCSSGLKPSFIMQGGITMAFTDIPEKQYPIVCFNYIHQNPVKAKLVSRATDWEFSSALDYAGLRNGKLVNKELAMEYIHPYILTR